MKSLYLIKPAMLVMVTLIFTNLPLQAQQTKNVAVSNFNEVSVSAGLSLIITQGSSESAKIVAEEGVIDEVELVKSGNRLSVKWKENFGFQWKNRNASVYVNYKKLNGLKASSGSSLKTQNLLTTDNLDVDVSSGASVNAQISCTDLNLETSSGSSAKLSGKANNMILKSSSGSTVNTKDLATEYAKIHSSSGADVAVNVSKALETSSSSGSSIRYKGNAALKNTSSSRSSSVSRID
jgi:hypothetical protein